MQKIFYWNASKQKQNRGKYSLILWNIELTTYLYYNNKKKLPTKACPPLRCFPFTFNSQTQMIARVREVFKNYLEFTRPKPGFEAQIYLKCIKKGRTYCSPFTHTIILYICIIIKNKQTKKWMVWCWIKLIQHTHKYTNVTNWNDVFLFLISNIS